MDVKFAILIPVLIVVTVIAVKLVFSFGSLLIQMLGQLLFAIHALIVSAILGIVVSSLLRAYFSANWCIGIGIASFMIVLGFLGYMVSNVAHPVISYLICVSFGIMDGYYVGGFLVDCIMPKFVQVDSFHIAAAYVGAVVGMIFVFLNAKKSMTPTGIDELDDNVVKVGAP